MHLIQVLDFSPGREAGNRRYFRNAKRSQNEVTENTETTTTFTQPPTNLNYEFRAVFQPWKVEQSKLLDKHVRGKGGRDGLKDCIFEGKARPGSHTSFAR